MIPAYRDHYNRNFSEEKYKAFLQALHQQYDFPIKFRVAETPVFIHKALKEKLITASDSIIDFIVRDDFKSLTREAIPPALHVPHEDDHTLFLALDFALVKDASVEIQPRLIEMQGFPSLYGWQDFLATCYREHFQIPEAVESHFGLTQSEYKDQLRRVVLNGHDPEEVVLLEIDPLNQNTAIDFIITRDYTGIEPVHIGDVKKEGRKLFYSKAGKKIEIKRLYNRVIFDELFAQKTGPFEFNLTEDVAVEWAGHPNWFFRISKFTMPLIKSEYVPECRFLHEYGSFPDDLENYVLKPLFSFSGSGIVFHVTEKDLNAIPKDQYAHYLLQRKVNYEPVIQAPDGLVKTEIRLLFIWETNRPRPQLVTNLVRLSRGEMIGVKFNQNKTWVGGSVGFFEK